MGINISKVQMVRRENLETRLVSLVIDIFEKFFLRVAQNASLIQPDEDRRDISKKLDRSTKYTF